MNPQHYNTRETELDQAFLRTNDGVFDASTRERLNPGICMFVEGRK